MQVDGIEYVFLASRLANLAWELDCLAGFGRCSLPAFQQVWRAKLEHSADLRNALGVWTSERRAARGPVGEHPESRSRLPLPHANGDLWQRVRLASVLAADVSEYERIVSTLTDRRTGASLRHALERFDAAFGDTWQQALPVLGAAMGEQVALQRRPGVARTIRQAVDFYGADLGQHPTIRFDLLFRPENASADYGTQLLGHGFVEVVASQRAAQRIQVPLHEMFHYLFASAPFSELDDLANRFVAVRGGQALAAYGLLDEVLATGLAQGVLARELSFDSREQSTTERALYADPFIDGVTKAFLPTLTELLRRPASGGTVFKPEFLTSYLAAVKTAFPRGLPPAAEMRPLACAYSRGFEKAYETLSAATASPVIGSSDQVDSEDGRALLEDRTTWGRVLLLKTTELSALSRYRTSIGPTTFEAVRRAARVNKRFAYATRSPGAGPFFVLMADAGADSEELVNKFLVLDVPFSGLALTSPRTSHGYR